MLWCNYKFPLEQICKNSKINYRPLNLNYCTLLQILLFKSATITRQSATLKDIILLICNIWNGFLGVSICRTCPGPGTLACCRGVERPCPAWAQSPPFSSWKMEQGRWDNWSPHRTGYPGQSEVNKNHESCWILGILTYIESIHNRLDHREGSIVHHGQTGLPQEANITVRCAWEQNEGIALSSNDPRRRLCYALKDQDIFLSYLPESGEVQVAINWMLVPEPSNLVMANTPSPEPGLLMMWAVSPTIATGTLIVKVSSHSQVWFLRTSDVAAISWPRSQTLKVKFKGSPFGTRTLRSSNLKVKMIIWCIMPNLKYLLNTQRSWSNTKYYGVDWWNC